MLTSLRLVQLAGLLPMFCINADLHLQVSDRPIAELLLRPSDSEGLPLQPAKYVHDAMSRGEGAALDEWVALRACQIRHRLDTAGIKLLLAVNLTPDSIRAPEIISSALSPPFRLEITEDFIIGCGDRERLIQFAERMVKSGYSISLDDLSEASDAQDKWRLLTAYVAEIKLDIGPNTVLTQALDGGRLWADDVTHGIQAIIESAAIAGKEITLERGDQGRAERFKRELYRIGVPNSLIARQDFDIHRPESVEAYLARSVGP